MKILGAGTSDFVSEIRATGGAALVQALAGLHHARDCPYVPAATGVPPRLSYATAEGRVGARGVWRVERLLTGGMSSTVAARAHGSAEVVRVA
ncbi:MAG TPA: hypothetical protein VKS99_10840 [Blastocatellia bacterium]|nr:hypothetical protein [Blastocatellia bacterium]